MQRQLPTEMTGKSEVAMTAGRTRSVCRLGEEEPRSRRFAARGYLWRPGFRVPSGGPKKSRHLVCVLGFEFQVPNELSSSSNKLCNEGKTGFCLVCYSYHTSEYA